MSKKDKRVFNNLDTAAFESSVSDVQFGEPETWKDKVPEYLAKRDQIKAAANEPSAIEKWQQIEKTMTPSQRRAFYKDKKEKPKDLYKDIPKVIMPDPIPTKSDLNFSTNFSTKEDDLILQKLKDMKKRDPDLDKGLASLGIYLD